MSCADFDDQLKRTYGFRPSKLDAAAQATKSKEMDEVWSAVRANPGTLGPCLKAALARPTDDNWFLFDGSQLLASIDSSDNARELLLQALSRVSLEDVDLRQWVGIASDLGLKGFDTSALGKRWLLYPKAEYFLPEHGAYRVDRGNGAMFLFGTLDEKFATPALTKLAQEGSGEVKEIAMWLLMSQATPEALQELSQLNTAGLSAKALASVKALREKPDLIVRRTPPKTTRAEFVAAFNALLAGDESLFNGLIESVPDGERDLVTVATPADLDLIRKVRRYYIAKNSPHAIEYYNQFSQILMTLVWKPPALSPNAPQDDPVSVTANELKRLHEELEVREGDIVDWVITHADGSEEGNLIGKYLEQSH